MNKEPNIPEVSEVETPPDEKASDIKNSLGGITLEPQPSDDPKDPLNWPLWKKNVTFAIWVLAAFSSQTSALANIHGSTLQAPVYNKKPIEVFYSIPFTLAGYVIGSISTVPLGRRYGTAFCLLWSSVFLLMTSVFSFMASQPSFYVIFVLYRFIAGVVSSVPLVLGSEAALQMYFQHQRGKCLHLLHVSFMLGVAVASIASAIITATTPLWPLQFWWTAGPEALVVILVVVILEDTAFDRMPTDDSTHTELLISKRRWKTYVSGAALPHPVTWRQFPGILADEVIIGLCPVSILSSLFMMIDFGMAVIAFALGSILLERPESEGGYDMPEIIMVPYLFTPIIGFLLAELYGHLINDRLPLWLHQRRKIGSPWRPEYRLHCLWVPAILSPIGLGILAAGFQYHLPGEVLGFALTLISFGSVSTVSITMTYLCECFPQHIPETSAIMSFPRVILCILGMLFVEPWVKSVGATWVFGTTALLSIPAFMLVGLLMLNGDLIRLMGFSRFSNDRDEN